MSSRAPLLLLLLAAPSLAAADHAGMRYHGAGGPFLSAGLVSAGGRTLVLGSTGGAGYSYHLGGRLRVGGGGQGTVASSRDGGWSGSVGWGGLHLGIDPLGEGDWEFPLALEVGGGRLSLERRLAAGDPELLERSTAPFFTAKGCLGAEYRFARTMKASLQVGYQVGLHEGVAFHGAELSLRLVFLLPRPGI